ncbi:MAG: hypothetical protein Q9191_006109 [Dirinaria sp. TL-2023a]
MAPPSQSGRGSKSRGVTERSPNLPDRPSPTREKNLNDETTSALHAHRDLQSSMKRLAISEKVVIRSPADADGPGRASLRFDDEQTHISCSSTKQTSSDSRSATSGATCALDEKESLRPDDSASTRAVEEEDSCSGVASAAPSSRVGSEAGGRAFRDQFNEISERIGPSLHRLQSINRRGIPGIVEEGSQPTNAPNDPTVPAPINGPEGLAANGRSFIIEYKGPDEKLFEALESPKDRLFLIRLEQEVISFIKNSNDPILDLPPCNSFCRLLAHKLADYYALTHYVDNAVSSVRLYRTPYCRIPTPLSALAKQSVPKDSMPTSQPSMKIMRREGAGKDGVNAGSGANTTTSSMAASKANSEIGDDSQRGTGLASPTDSVTAKERATMTREEREAKYKETRERIFKGFEDAENAEANQSSELVNEMSRTSSSAGKKKSKKSKHHDDGFEARSKFNAYYPAMQYPPSQYPASQYPPSQYPPSQYPMSDYKQTAGAMVYFNPYSAEQDAMMNQSGMLNTPIFSNPYSHGYPPVPNGPMYQMGMQTPMMPGSDMASQSNGLCSYGGYSQQFPQAYDQQMMQQPVMGQQSPVMSSPALSNNPQLSRPSSQMSDQSYVQNSYSYGYQQPPQPQPSYSPHLHHRTPARSVPSVPYQYGQLPYEPNHPPGKAQHPLPGSYSRQAFNPQTRAFVPSSGGNASQSPSFSAPTSTPIRSPLANLSNGSANSPHSKQTGNPHNSSKNTSSTPAHSHRSTSNHSSPQPSTLAKWGTPANLPPKPPPPETPAAPDSLPTNPTTMHGPIPMQPMMHGQPMPSYQNGIYSMPGGK